MTNPKILLFDLETGGVNALKSDLGMILCFGYKFLGDKKAKVLTVDMFPNWFSTEKGVNDAGITKAALAIMETADIIVAHYGEKFDRKFFQGRCLVNNLTPPPPTKLRDTWRIARTAFNFSSNRLGNLAKVLKLPQQKQEKKGDAWPGWWIRSMAGDRKAIREMAAYCAQDIQTLEALYLRLRAYDNPHPRLITDRALCRLCGGNVEYRGVAFVGENHYRRFQCKICGKWDRESRKME